AARAIVAQAIDDIIRGGGRVGNWMSYSSLAAIPDPSLDDIGALEDLVFHGQGIGQGWGAFVSGLREDARFLGEISDMVAVDLSMDQLAAVRLVCERLEDAAKAAFSVSEGERA